MTIRSILLALTLSTIAPIVLADTLPGSASGQRAIQHDAPTRPRGAIPRTSRPRASEPTRLDDDLEHGRTHIGDTAESPSERLDDNAQRLNDKIERRRQAFERDRSE